MRALLESLTLRPRICVWEITSRCNMRCLHCASDFAGARPRGEELDLREALDLCSQLAELGCEKVVLSGGEALLRKDWEDIAQRLVSLGVAVSVISNGFVIGQEVAQRLRAAGVARVGLSLDGLQDTHNFIRHNQRSFHRVVRAAGHLVENAIPINIITHVNRRNLAELALMENLVVSLEASVWRLQLGAPLGNMARHPELVIAPEDLPAVADFVVAAKRRRSITISVGDNIGYFSDHESELRSTPNRGGLDFWCGCSAGCMTIGIEANGNIKGCLSLQSADFVEGNIRDSTLHEIWRRPDAFRYTRGFEKSDLKGHCLNCELGEICRGGCTFMAYSATGSIHDNPYCLYGLQRRARNEIRCS